MRPKIKPESPIHDAAVAVLLMGWSAIEHRALSREAKTELRALLGPGRSYEHSIRAIASTWRAHEPFLLDEAQRRRATPKFSIGGRRVFFGERIARYLEAR